MKQPASQASRMGYGAGLTTFLAIGENAVFSSTESVNIQLLFR